MIFICCLVVFCVIIAMTSFIFITQENYDNIDFSEKKVKSEEFLGDGYFCKSFRVDNTEYSQQ